MYDSMSADEGEGMTTRGSEHADRGAGLMRGMTHARGALTWQSRSKGLNLSWTCAVAHFGRTVGPYGVCVPWVRWKCKMGRLRLLTLGQQPAGQDFDFMRFILVVLRVGLRARCKRFTPL